MYYIYIIYMYIYYIGVFRGFPAFLGNLDLDLTRSHLKIKNSFLGVTPRLDLKI